MGGTRPPAALDEARAPATPHGLVAYVSQLLADRLASGGAIEDVEASRLHAALLLTDVAGFTADVERVSAARPAGLEELARDFDAYFTTVVGTVHEFGGDVLAIAGDAFFSVWPADPGELDTAIARATEAGLAVHERTGHRFRTRAGVAAGELELGFVGGVGGRWELMPAGAVLDEVASAERLARPGTVALAAKAWDIVAPRADGRPLHDGVVELTGLRRPAGRPAVSPGARAVPPGDLLTPFVPLPVRRRDPATGTEWLQEKRSVTVVMVHLGAGAAGLQLRHEGVRAFQRVVAELEGASKLLVDSKGVALSAVFGLPPRAHADDPRRAVTAAERLRRELCDLGLACRIGVATGPAFCGVFGSDVRREYTLHGEVINLAARLMGVGDGDVLCTQETVAAAGDGLAFEPLDPVTVRGRRRPVAIHRVAGRRRAARAGGATMIGREGERALLRARLDDGRATVLIEGEAGLGKSRLAADAIEVARARGVRVLEAAADPVERATSYHAWRSVITDALRDVALDGEQRRLLPLLNGIVPLALPEDELTRALDGSARAERTTALLASILRAATAGAPLLLVVEDAHWLDSGSWSLLLELTASLPQLVAVVTARPAADLPAPYARLRAAATDVVELDRLTTEETGALVRNRLGVEHLPADLEAFVEDRVAGHPFFCEQLVQSLRERGVVDVRDGAVTVGELAGLDVPATLQGAVLSRIDRLTAAQLLCLKVAAVVGRSFLVRTVAEALPAAVARDEVPGHLAALAALGLTAPDAAQGEPAYRFCHQITRDAAYGLLTADQARRLHRAVAEWHERTSTAAELAAQHALLAHHWARADDPERAVAALTRAGLHAVRTGAFREALPFLDEALAVEGARRDPVREAACETGRGTAHYFLGDFGRSRASLERALALLGRPFPRTATGVARGLVREIGVQAAHITRPGRYRGRREAERERIADALVSYKILGQIGYLDGEPTAVLLYGTLAGLNLGEEAGPSPDLARMLIHAATAASIVGLERRADRYAERAIAMVDGGAQRQAGAYVWNIWAVIGAHRGRWAVARAANQTALDRLAEVGDFNLEAELWQTRAAIELFSGAFADADGAWMRHRELADRKGNAQNRCWSLLDEAQARVGRGETAAAAVALEAALAIPTDRGDVSSTMEKHYATALVRAAQGRWSEAVAAAHAILSPLRRPPPGFHHVEFCAGATEVCLDALQAGVRDRAAVLRLARHGCAIVRRSARQFGSVRARRWLLEGRLEWELGEPERARRAWRRAGRTAATMDMPFDLARVRLELGRHAPRGPERAALLAEAAATFEGLGAGQLLRLAKEAQR